MNCKPKDLAMIVRADPGWEDSIGQVIQLLDGGYEDKGEWAWYIEPITYRGVRYHGVIDRVLQPIRPPRVTTEINEAMYA